MTALNITGTGNTGSPLSLTYPVTLQADNSSIASASVSYRTYTVQTNFGCSGISEYGATSVDLTDKITLADGSIYSFSYEPTTGVSGAVTGRIASVTLPTGGAINYSYTGGCNGSGMNPDGTVGSLTRTTGDGTRSYNRAPVSNNATSTTLQDEKQNQTLYQFSNVGDFFYETHRQAYQGAVGGSNLLDLYTCYDGAQPPCDGGAITLPIISTIALSSYNGGTQAETDNIYTASGFLTSSTQKGGGSTLQATAITYNSVGGVLSSTTKDGSGTVVASSTYGYDESAPTATSGIPQHVAASGTRGNQTSSHISIGSGTLDTTTTYYDTGVPVSTKTPNGTTTYSYESTKTFATGTTLPTPSSGVQLATSASYDQQSGVLISATGMNSGQTTQVKQYDRLLRPSIVSLPNGGQITYTYSPTHTGVAQTTGTGPNADTETQLDIYGRTSRVAVYNGLSSNGWYQVDYCYDSTGLLQFQSTSYQGTGFIATKQCSGNGTSYVYDALERMTSSSNADGTTSYQYTNRAVLKTDVNGVQRITQSDLLGRTSGVCEISSNANMPGQESPVTCGMDIAGNGFVTGYAYDLANHKTTATQGHQTRVFQTDAAGRTTQTNEPERGQTNYSYTYNSTGLVVTRQRPIANLPGSSALTTTTTQYDSVGRVVSVSYSDGTPTKNFTYDQAGAWGGSVSLGASKGMLTQHKTNVAGNWAGAAYGYDLMGRVIWSDQCVPSGCVTTSHDKLFNYSYDYLGNMTSASDGAGVTTSYSYSPASEVQSITSSLRDATHPGTLVSKVQNGPNGPLSWSLGNGLTSVNEYNSVSRLDGNWVCSNGSTATSCGGGSNPIVSYSQANITGKRVNWRCDTSVSEGCDDFSYDEFGRLHGMNSYGVHKYTYAYDRYGNRWQQNALQGGPSPQLSFDASTNRVAGYSYDAAGNVMSDGINTYQYDAEGNLIQETSGSTFTFSYNALNQQVRANYGSSASEIVFNLSGQIASLWNSGANTPIMGKAYWGSTPIESYQTGSNTAYFQHWDWLGSLRAETNATGGLSDARATLPFGDGAANTSGSRDNSFDGFAGLWDGKNGATNHAQYREYSNVAGRWLQPDPYDGSYDPSDPQSFNRYAYVLNTPLSAIDPWGLGPQDCENPGDPGCIITIVMPPVYYHPPDPPPGNPGDHGPGGGGGGAPSKPCPATPNLLPHGVAVVGAAEASTGLSKLGGTIQASGGYGRFGSFFSNGGWFGSYVGTAVAGSNIVGAPYQSGGSTPTIVGLAGGIGLGGLVTNATDVRQLFGPFHQITLSLPALSFAFSYGGCIWSFQTVAGPADGAATTSTTTNTITSKGPC